MKVSVLIPCYNAVDKIGRCLASLRDIYMPRNDYEVLFIDDCSTDGTFALLQRECAVERNWRVEQLETNSGSPSRPRNRGVAMANGEYVFFLDCDDEILPDTLCLHWTHAIATNADIVRGYLLADDGRVRKPMNRLAGWQDTLTRQERIATVISHQSTVPTSLIRKGLLRENGILWAEDIRMGEDTVFLATTLATATRIEYLDHPTYVYNKLPALTASSTQSYGARELRDHLKVWREAHQILAPEGVNYISLRLQVGLQTTLAALIFRNRGDIDNNLFQQFSDFVQTHWGVIGRFNYIARYKEILAAAQKCDFRTFQRLCRPRLLIAGYDLKFITSVVPELERHFDIRVDEWPGHDRHDEIKSRELLEWAELIWCEWLLGNAVWYSANKRSHQRLIIRMHRFELSRDFGEKLKIENVDTVTAVSTHFFERLLERFPSIPRAKARLLPNYVKTAEYRRDFNEKRLYTLGMIGILPSRKGFDKALEILARLRRYDSRYRLEIFGKIPEELPWIARDVVEMAYFDKCYALISENNLENAVTFHGQSDVKTALAERNVGFVLSTSDSMYEFPGSESFHLAIADGFAAGGISLVLDWMGAEYIWPAEFICSSMEEIVSKIRHFSETSDVFQTASEQGLKFVESYYDSEIFVPAIKRLYMDVL